MQTLNSIFLGIERATEQSRDTLNKFDFDPTQETHIKLQQDFRQGLVMLLSSCHPLCVKDAQSATLSSSEQRCLQQCVESNVGGMRRLFRDTAPNKDGN